MNRNLFFRILSIFSVSLLAVSAKAQTVPGSAGMRNDTIKKQILDYSVYRVYYDMEFVYDLDFPEDSEKTLTVLQIGNKASKFWDYNELRADSINDDGVRKKKSLMEYMGVLSNCLKNQKFKSSILTERETKTLTEQRSVVLSERYQYKTPVPKPEWEILPGDTVIAGYECKKAKCSLYGRDYTAWYAPEISLPSGPFKFSGLPGLIFKVSDSRNHYSFTLCGLEKAPAGEPIYLKTGKRVIPSSREEVLRIYRNYCANPGKAIMNSGKNIKISSEDLAGIEPKPYNPIELE